MIFVYWEWWISIEATQICYFRLALSCIGSQPTRLSYVLNLKNLKAIWGVNLIFCFHWSYIKYSHYFGLCWKILLANQFAGFFSFDLLILIVGVHCYIVLVLLDWFMWKTRVTQIRWFGKSIVQCIIIRPTHYIQSLKCNILCCIISISRKYEM